MSKEHLVDADAITEAFVATARSDVVQLDVDGEIVLYDDRTKVMHRLSPSAGQVWRCLDGSGSLAEIAADLADVYQADRELVLHDVVTTTRQFASVGLLEGVDAQFQGDEDRPVGEDASGLSDPHEEEGPVGPFVPDLAASWMDSWYPLGDAGSLTVKAGPYLLGVRFSTSELVDSARKALASSIVEGVVAPSNVSVKLTQPRAGRPLFYCYRSNVVLTRARSPRRAVEAAARMLSSYVPPAAGNIRMAAMLAVRSGVAALFCPESWQAASRLVPRLRASGWDVLDTTEVDLDRDGRVVIAPLAVGLDAAALALLPGDRNDGARAVPGRYPVAAWVDVAGSDAMPMTMAAGVARASAGVPDLDAGAAPSAIEAVTAMLRHADCVLSPTTSARDLAETLARAVP